MRIFVFGSLNIDYVFHVNDIVIPGQTVSSDKLDINNGGKGFNQAIAAARAGAEVLLAGAVAKKDADFLAEILASSGVDASLLDVDHRTTGHAIIQVDRKGQNCIVLYGGANQEITKAYVDRVMAQMENSDILLLQNEISEIPYIMKQAHQKGIKIFMNPSPIDHKLLEYPLKYADTLILNEIEGAQISGEGCLEKIPDALLKLFPDMKIVLTLGKGGVVYADRSEKLRYGIYDVPVVDTTAAGDTFTGYYLACVCHGGKIAEALKIASAASSIAVSHSGASCSIPALRDVQTFLENHPSTV